MSTHSKLFSSNSSPQRVDKTAGVRRVNNLPIVIFGAIMLVFMLLMMIVAMNRAAERNQAILSLAGAASEVEAEVARAVTALQFQDLVSQLLSQIRPRPDPFRANG